MNFISYAQNFEDVLLWRALKHLPTGFYIDVGANDPIVDSVTNGFYQRGWSGINLEPLPDFHQRLQIERTRDINLALAAGADNGQVTLYDVPARRGWASLDKSVAAEHKAQGFDIVECSVPLVKLADVCRQHVSGDINFLKIDVEGFETEVLLGMDFGRWRPWIVVVEATLPNTQVVSYQQWEGLLTGQRYRFAYFDGLNRYYVADEHADLLEALQVQANFFDDFTPVTVIRTWEAENRCNDAILKLQELQSGIAIARTQAVQSRLDAEQAREQLRKAESRLQAAELAAKESKAIAEQAAQERPVAAQTKVEIAELAAATAAARADEIYAHRAQILASASWRLTQPLRLLKYWIRQPALSFPRRLAIRKSIGRLVGWVISREVLRRSLIPKLARVPWLDKKVTHAVALLRDAPRPPVLDPVGIELPAKILDLPVSARIVLDDLRSGNEVAPLR